MNDIKTELLAILSELKGSGKFATTGKEGFIIPGIEIDEIGEVSFPLNEKQAKEIIRIAHKAPFGMGSSTIIDESVRKTWEIDAGNFRISNPSWTKLLDRIIKKTKENLGLEDYHIEANTYKLLVYEEGGFFLPHKDSEKEKGMFGTLIISLPSIHKGGELIIEFGNEREIVCFENKYDINFTAFYADCDHEIKPLLSGYRMCIVYNLIQHKTGKIIQPPSIYKDAEKLSQLFTQKDVKNEFMPHIILLSHQYTPENFSKNDLKLDDRIKAEALILAAEKAGFYSKMCLVTSFLEGTPKDDTYDYHYRSRYDDDDDDDDFDTEAEIDEVFNEELNIEHWAEDNLPQFDQIEFEEEDLITSFPLNENEPIIKQSTGYMGNYGPDVMYWYHYGAVMIWSPSTNSELILKDSPSTQLAWIDYFSRQNKMHSDELNVILRLITQGIEVSSRTLEKKNCNYDSIIKWIIKHNQIPLLFGLNEDRLKHYFNKIAIESWIELLEFLTTEDRKVFFSVITSNFSYDVVEKLPTLFISMLEKNILVELVIEQVKKYNLQLNDIYENEKKRVKLETLIALFRIDKKLQLGSDWTEEITKSLTNSINRDYVYNVVFLAIIHEKENCQLKDNLVVFVKYFLRKLIDNKPIEPLDWARELPESAKRNPDWNQLKAFLASPTEEIFDFRKNQNERTALENLIHNTNVDLSFETIRKGSPHTLRIKKTKASYMKLLGMWKEDVALLEKLENYH